MREGYRLTVGSCFSGIGGLELGLEWTGGFETKWQIENDEYAQRVLAKHWPTVKRYSDIRNVVRPEPVDVICGGFPCQDVSLAGARAGLEGKRSTLWTEMFRLVCEVKPRWVVAENVPGLLSSDRGKFFGNILRDLAGSGYDAEWGMLSAAGVGAPHLRRRVFIVADAERSGLATDLLVAVGKRSGRQKRATDWSEGGMRQPSGHGWNGIPETLRPDSPPEAWRNAAIEPLICGISDGISKRVDRLRCLGNAVVPQVAQKVGEMILAHLLQ